MSTAVMERTAEIGTLRAIGDRRASVRRLFMTEGLLLGLFGATLLYGDGIITPAITVLGAVEGLEVITDKVNAEVPSPFEGVLTQILVE